ncbi:MAG TPA: MFS transporter [Anaeromyxobacteraceae bacterium]|nr:MFS transporter [Anaeromyxobacteraceae bacterium]
MGLQRGASPEGRKWRVLASIGVGTFMSALDGSVVNTLLPVMRRALHTGVAEIEWVVTIYLLVVSGVLLGFGRLGDLRGHKDVYLVGFVGFVVSSALCGLAPSARFLVLFRAVQALAAAMLFANAPAILTKTFPPEQRGQALGLQATMTYLGLSTGPSLGGFLAQHLGWQSVFFINVPVGALGVFLCAKNIARDRPEGRPPPFDLAGAALFFAGLFALLLALNQGHSWGWSAPSTVGLFSCAVLVLAAFLAIERRRAHPMLDLSLFRKTAFSASAYSAMVSYVASYSILFLLPFYLIQARGLAADRAGLILTSQPLVMMTVAPLSGTLSDRFGSRRPAALGMLVLSAGLFWLSTTGASTPLGLVVCGLALCGLGFGTFVAPNNSRLLGAAPLHRQGIASGVLAAARNVGMVLGVGLAGAVYTTVLARLGPSAIPEAVSRGLKLAGALTATAVVTASLGAANPGSEASRAPPGEPAPGDSRRGASL